MSDNKDNSNNNNNNPNKRVKLVSCLSVNQTQKIKSLASDVYEELNNLTTRINLRRDRIPCLQPDFVLITADVSERKLDKLELIAVMHLLKEQHPEMKLSYTEMNDGKWVYSHDNKRHWELYTKAMIVRIIPIDEIEKAGDFPSVFKVNKK